MKQRIEKLKKETKTWFSEKINKTEKTLAKPLDQAKKKEDSNY